MTRPAGERRIVSVLLADIADSTAIGERLGPERSKFLFDEVTRLLAGEVKRFGGTIAQLTGDGLFALFGVPDAHDDDAERAVRAALAMQTVLAGYAKDVQEAYGVTLAGRVGVNTGPVVLLLDDAPAEERFNALGDTVNTAARLQSEAGTGGVAIGPVTARQVEAAFELEAIGPIALKGKADPLPVFLVSGEREHEARSLSPLVGRDAELALLDELFEELADGRGAIAAITGEPGIGKTRLVAEVRSHWQERVRFVGTQGISYAQDIPYYPLRELLRGFLGVGVADPEARVRLELKAQLAGALGEQADTHYPFLASLLGLKLEEDAEENLRTLARDSVQRQSHEAVVELARAISREQPLGLVLEDLHFADEPTLDLFEELLQLADEEAVAVLLLYRNDPDLPSWRLGEAARRRYRHRFSELQLEALAPADGARLAASAAGRDLSADVAAQLAERTGGNPLFLEEAARDAVERGDGAAAVPSAIQEILQARLDRLAPDVRDVASVASVVGRSFGLPLLERLVPPDRLRPALSELQRLDLVVEERRRPTPEYRFRHGLVQEAAYTSLLEERRRELHRVVGTTLEELDPDELSEAYGLLAHHFAAADEPQRAARYLLEAGNAARAIYADEEAIGHYRRALSFLDRLGDAQRARAALFKIALTHHLAFDFEAADAAWAEAFERPEPPAVQLDPTERLETAMLLPQSWAPGHSYDVFAWSMTPNLFRGLFRFGRDEVIPDLAERVSVSADGCTYVFRLRGGLRWSDGEPLTADDFAFGYQAMREQEVHTAFMLDDVEARATDDVTLEVRVAEPRTHMLYLFALPPSYPWPRHKVEALGVGWHEPKSTVTNGPFLIADASEERTVFARNPKWHGSLGNVGELTLDMIDPQEALDAWRVGRFDFLAQPDPPHLEGVSDTTIMPMVLPGLQHLAFPARPPFDDVRVRTAMAQAIDRSRITAGTQNLPAYGGFLPPTMPGHSHELAPAHDIAAARRLLAEAGYADGRGLPELRHIHADPGLGESIRREYEAKWEGQWRELGLRVRQEWVAFDRIPAEVDGDNLFWEWGWASDFPEPHGMLKTFLDSQPIPHDDELFSLLEQAQALRSRDARLELYRAADRRLVAECVWVVPTVYDMWIVMHRPHVEGIWTHPMGIGPLDDVVVRR